MMLPKNKYVKQHIKDNLNVINNQSVTRHCFDWWHCELLKVFCSLPIYAYNEHELSEITHVIEK